VRTSQASLASLVGGAQALCGACDAAPWRPRWRPSHGAKETKSAMRATSASHSSAGKSRAMPWCRAVHHALRVHGRLCACIQPRTAARGNAYAMLCACVGAQCACIRARSRGLHAHTRTGWMHARARRRCYVQAAWLLARAGTRVRGRSYMAATWNPRARHAPHALGAGGRRSSQLGAVEALGAASAVGRRSSPAREAREAPGAASVHAQAASRPV
jgi:hypothetical protein